MHFRTVNLIGLLACFALACGDDEPQPLPDDGDAGEGDAAQSDGGPGDSGVDADVAGDAGLDSAVDSGFDSGPPDAGVCPTAGQLSCGGSCVDVLKNPVHCGACDNACGEDTVCREGSCIDPGAIGCSDGEREGYTDRRQYPSIAACAGGFRVPGVSTADACDNGSATDGAGDDGQNPTGEGCSLADLCAEGWHVCERPAEILNLAGGFGCIAANETLDEQFFATQATGSGNGSCDGEGQNDIIGCGNFGADSGTECFHISRSLSSPDGDPIWDLGESTTEEAANVIKLGPSRGGAMCCADQQTVGCADGQRDGFTDLSRFPAIAGCAGGFDQPGVTLASSAQATCGFRGGDDGENPNGVGCSVADLCAPSWHVCHSAAEIEFFQARVREPFTCANGVEGLSGTFFTTRQSGSENGQCTFGATGSIFGCGSSDIGLAAPSVGAGECEPLDRFIGDVDFSGDWVLTGPAADQAETVTKPTPSSGGVLCCPNLVGG